jgi:hypothetical protein
VAALTIAAISAAMRSRSAGGSMTCALVPKPRTMKQAWSSSSKRTRTVIEPSTSVCRAHVPGLELCRGIRCQTQGGFISRSLLEKLRRRRGPVRDEVELRRSDSGRVEHRRLLDARHPIRTQPVRRICNQIPRSPLGNQAKRIDGALGAFAVGAAVLHGELAIARYRVLHSR